MIDLRRTLDESLRQHSSGEESAPWRIGHHQFQLADYGEGLRLRCCLQFQRRLDDENLRHVLEMALVSYLHFESSACIDHEKGQIILGATLGEPCLESLWSACERMVNQADMWTDAVCKELFPGRKVASSRAPLGALLNARPSSRF